MMTNYYSNIRNDVIKFLEPKKFDKILEIGGGEFDTLKKLIKNSLGEGWGVDIYEPKVPPNVFIKGSIENKVTIDRIPNDYFDLIMMNDALEHIWDTDFVLSTLRDKLKFDGAIVISVPNVRQIRFVWHIFIKGTFPQNESGMFDKTHRRWFTKRDIIKKCELAGFRTEKVENIGRLIRKPYSQSLIGELLGLQTLLLARKR